MRPAPSYLRNYEAVMTAFGYWPSFHDAPVLAFRFSEEAGGEVELALHGWEMTGAVDDRGYFKLIKHHLVRFVFREISDAELHQFTADNILLELGLSSPEEFEVTRKFGVTLDSAMGSDLCGSFSASTGEILDVTPCDEKGNKT